MQGSVWTRRRASMARIPSILGHGDEDDEAMTVRVHHVHVTVRIRRHGGDGRGSGDRLEHYFDLTRLSVELEHPTIAISDVDHRTCIEGHAVRTNHGRSGRREHGDESAVAAELYQCPRIIVFTVDDEQLFTVTAGPH